MAYETPNFAALLPALATDLVVEERPIPVPGPGEVLVRNHVIALNPIDWKRQSWGFLVPSYPAILGTDHAGTITAVGAGVTTLAAGDRILGFPDGFLTGIASHSAFQTYTVVSASLATKLPTSLSFSSAATLPTAAAYATLALFGFLGLPLPTTALPTPPTGRGILVWGASSSVGALTVQAAAKLAGLTVIATASPAHHAKLRGLGAAAVVDYHSADVVGEIVAAAAAAGVEIAYAVDAISEAATLKPTVEVLGKFPGEGLRLVHSLPWPADLAKPEGWSVAQVQGEQAFGERKELAQWLFSQNLGKWLEEGAIVPGAHRVVEGGLGGIQSGLNELKAGKVSSEKLVVEV
ncbi:chaperonin 10-like protein [Lasiosphaeris hirsuta]|uniref:Chaperonin 10-like protein n=1 Tax=Lasiosphaeris hirsuta TaxID=260670 RepID=A0AA40A3L7_9PEZI|nr:chaperonin 10-like protein [Lasiosphaeris hirsuta]